MSLTDFRPVAVEARPWWRSPRWIGAGLVVAVHIVAVAFLATSLTTTRLTLPTQREIYFFFRPKPPPPAPPRKPVFIPPAEPTAPVFPEAPLPPAPTALIPPDVKGLGQSLFGCAPENLANLTPQERAHCSGAPGIASADSDLRAGFVEHALQAARWSAALHARNTPLTVPCVTPPTGGLGSSLAPPLVDPHCELIEKMNAQDFGK